MNTLPMSRAYHNHSFWNEFLLTLALETKDMCHGTSIPSDTIIEVGDLGLVSM